MCLLQPSGKFIKHLIYVNLCFNIYLPIQAYYQHLEVCHHQWRSCANDSKRKGWTNEQPSKASDPGSGLLEVTCDLGVVQGQNANRHLGKIKMLPLIEDPC